MQVEKLIATITSMNMEMVMCVVMVMGNVIINKEDA